MQRTFEIIFRHPWRLLAMLILIPAVSLAAVSFLPRSYEATATLFSLHRYSVIGSTGSESDLLSTPAETQATTLTELLQTRLFCLAVASEATLDTTLDAATRADPQKRDDALYKDLSTHVLAVAQGANLVIITYDNKSPQMAQQVVQAVIDQYASQGVSYAIIDGQRQLSVYQTQLANAQKQASTAAAAEAQYIAQHPTMSHADLLNNPQYVLLHAQTLQAQSTVQNLQTSIATLNQSIAVIQGGNKSSTLFSVVDAPVVPTKAVSRVKLFLLGGIGGLVGGLLACALYLVLAFRRDRAIYSPMDVAKVTALPVLTLLPDISPRRASLAISGPFAGILSR
ncbi:MAG: hypothetical protein OJF49_001940 [Ktedonobacterales bacterium]|nr:MAG: hypothetical protein OJF49_001940 [Ktedonobacterales bacterium]